MKAMAHSMGTTLSARRSVVQSTSESGGSWSEDGFEDGDSYSGGDGGGVQPSILQSKNSAISKLSFEVEEEEDEDEDEYMLFGVSDIVSHM